MSTQKISRTFRMERDIIELLDKTPNASAYIDESLRSATAFARSAITYLRQKGWSANLLVAVLQSNYTHQFTIGLGYRQMLTNLEDELTRGGLASQMSLEEDEVERALDGFDEHQGHALYVVWREYRLGGPIVEELERLLLPETRLRLFLDQAIENLDEDGARALRRFLDLGADRTERHVDWGGTKFRSMMLYFPSMNMLAPDKKRSFLKVMSGGSVWLRHEGRDIALTGDEITTRLEAIGIDEYKVANENVIIKFEDWRDHLDDLYGVLEEMLD